MPGFLNFVESAVCNALNLWPILQFVSMGINCTTAFGVVDTTRLRLIMMPVQALEAASLAFGGYAWGKWRVQAGGGRARIQALKQDIIYVKSIPAPEVLYMF